MNKRLSFSTYSMCNAQAAGIVNLFSMMELAKFRYHLDYIDIWSGSLDSLEDTYLELVADNLKERCLKVANLCADGAQVWADDPTRRELQYKTALKYLHVAEKLGIETIRFDIGVMDEEFSDENFSYVVEKYKEYCKIAARFGCKIGPENHTGLSRAPAQLQRLLDTVKEPNFGLLLHLNGWYTGDPDQNDMHFIQYAMHTHIDYEQCFYAGDHIRALTETGYKGAWSAECHHTTNQLNAVEVQVTNMRRVLNPMSYDGSWKIAPPSVVAENNIDQF